MLAMPCGGARPDGAVGRMSALDWQDWQGLAGLGRWRGGVCDAVGCSGPVGTWTERDSGRVGAACAASRVENGGATGLGEQAWRRRRANCKIIERVCHAHQRRHPGPVRLL
jgi:hypothetical protein